MRYLAVLFLFVSFAGCATVSDDQCREGNWEKIGFRDGADGRRPDFVDNHVSACSDLRVKPDIAAWREGRDQGLVYYCTPTKAYIEGRRGIILKDFCPPELQSELIRQNRRGLAANHVIQEDRQRFEIAVTFNAGLFRLPPSVLQGPDGTTERDYYSDDIQRLRNERLYF